MPIESPTAEDASRTPGRTSRMLNLPMLLIGFGLGVVAAKILSMTMHD